MRFSGYAAGTLALLLTSSALWAEPVVLESPEARVHLLELYTSEGCSSCPPADRWLSGLRRDADLWQQVVPVAFHVTYWNDLGWPDRFSDAAFDRRQRARARLAGAGVYTPGVFIDGDEWRSWRRQPGAYESLPRKPAGVLRVSLDGGRAEIAFDAARDLQKPSVELAWLQTARATNVKAGENRGRRLVHDFIVRTLSRHALVEEDGIWRAAVGAARPPDSQGVAVWIVDRHQRPVQATGGWLEGE